MRPAPFVLSAIVLAGCAHFAGGVVATPAQAIAIADRDCGKAFDGAHPTAWDARLDAGVWTVWQRRERLVFYVEIDAKTGALGKDGCGFTPAP